MDNSQICTDCIMRTDLTNLTVIIWINADIGFKLKRIIQAYNTSA